MTYLLDTNIISEVMRRAPNPRVIAWFTTLETVATSAICLEELVFGLRRRNAYGKEAWLRRMLADVGVVFPVTDSQAQWSGERRASLESQGRTVHQTDACIAACAWQHGLVLATRNTRDFEGYGIPIFDPFTFE